MSRSVIQLNITCIPQEDYFGSPQFYSTSMHIVSVIATPIHSLGLFCILFKTPDQMKSIKFYLLVLHIWVMAFDYSLTLFTIPFILAPGLAGYSLGLYKYFNVPFMIQVIIILALFAWMMFAAVSIFENRFYTICTFSWKKHWSFWRRPWLAIHYIGDVILLIPVAIFVPDQKTALIKTYKRLPCLPQEVYEAPIVVAADDYTYHFIAAFFGVILITSEIFFFVGFLVSNSIQQLKQKTMSQKTYNMQKKLLIALVIQSFVPMTFFMFPLVYGMVVVIKEYYNQAIVNILFINGSMHGFVSTLAMLFLHRPYREATLNIFSVLQKKPSPEISHNVVSNNYVPRNSTRRVQVW